MLKKLYIENFALVDALEINLDTGLSVMTGETGAGKSIIVGALARLMGEKTDKDDIRSGSTLAVIEGVFDIRGNNHAKEALDKIKVEYDNEFISIRKEIHTRRATKNFINGQPLNLNQLKSVTRELAELFGQHSHQQLLDEKNHQSFLDNFAQITDEVDRLRDIYLQWQNVSNELQRMIRNKTALKNERELLLFQKAEIEKARIRIGEEEELLAEKKILDSSQILGEKCSLILEMIDHDENSATNIVGRCRKEFSSIISLDKSLENNANLLEQAAINLDELRSQLETYISSIPDDPRRLEEINLRLDEIYRLRKKYGGSEDSILAALDEINRQLEKKVDIDRQIALLEAEEAILRDKYQILATKISLSRKKAAGKLSKVVKNELNELGIDEAQFEYEFQYEYDPEGIELDGRSIKPTAEGFESGRFLVSANPGEPLRPLATTASGGEISRIMLALKSADKAADKGRRSLLVFDEIDSGIGGQTANMVADKLAKLAENQQLMVITHLHQIAAVSHTHFAVEKTASDTHGGRNIISVKKLDKTSRQKEIERMISLPKTNS